MTLIRVVAPIWLESIGSILGSAIGGLSGGPRGSDMGTIIGMAGGAAVGAVIGSQADQRQQQQVKQYQQDRQGPSVSRERPARYPSSTNAIGQSDYEQMRFMAIAIRLRLSSICL